MFLDFDACFCLDNNCKGVCVGGVEWKYTYIDDFMAQLDLGTIENVEIYNWL